MSTNVKRMKLWILSIVLGLLFLVLCGFGYLYYQVKSISLTDIKGRLQAVETVNVSVSKKVKAQDALDIMALLMNSGFSLKEIYWLQGSSLDNVSIKEKQRMRDLLLEKLTQEEREVLQAILTQYGKSLSILDPNDPIQADGVQDKKERESPILESEKKIEVETAKPDTDPSESATAPVKPDPDSVIDQPEPSINPITQDQQAKREQVKKSYNAKLAALQANCVTRSNELLAELVSAIQQKQASGEKVSASLLQNTFLPKIVESEGHCDQKLVNLIKNAKKEYVATGLDLKELNGWQAQYNAAKEEARSNALSQLIDILSRS